MKEYYSKSNYGAYPSFFIACCHQAARGGSYSYATAAYELMRNLACILPFEGDFDETEQMERLATLLEAGDESGVLSWFKRWAPRCVALIPTRRMPSFIQGVFTRYNEVGYVET